MLVKYSSNSTDVLKGRTSEGSDQRNKLVFRHAFGERKDIVQFSSLGRDTLLSPIPLPINATILRALPHDSEGMNRQSKLT